MNFFSEILRYARYMPLAAVLALTAAFVLTFNRQRASYSVLVILYAIGMALSLGPVVGASIFALVIGYETSHGTESFHAFLLLIPFAIGVYIVASIATLTPRIPQPAALGWGRLLHGILLPLSLALIAGVAVAAGGGGLIMRLLPWLVFGPLWFSIRETCETCERTKAEKSEEA